jgi:chemotaxis response regulator CheB
MQKHASSEIQPPDQGAESQPTPPNFKVVALAASAGGLAALSGILAALPTDFPAAIVIVQHRAVMSDNYSSPVTTIKIPHPALR